MEAESQHPEEIFEFEEIKAEDLESNQNILQTEIEDSNDECKSNEDGSLNSSFYKKKRNIIGEENAESEEEYFSAEEIKTPQKSNAENTELNEETVEEKSKSNFKLKKKRKSSTSKDDECTNSENIFEGNFDERCFRTLGSEVIKKLSEFKDLDQQESNLTVNEEILNDDMNEEAKSDSEDCSKEIRLKHQPESYNQNDNPFEVIESKVERNKKIATDSDSNQNVQDREFNMMETRPKSHSVSKKIRKEKLDAKINKQSNNPIEEVHEVSESEDDSKPKIKKEKSAKTDKTSEKISHEKDLSHKYKVIQKKKLSMLKKLQNKKTRSKEKKSIHKSNAEKPINSHKKEHNKKKKDHDEEEEEEKEKIDSNSKKQKETKNKSSEKRKRYEKSKTEEDTKKEKKKNKDKKMESDGKDKKESRKRSKKRKSSDSRPFKYDPEYQNKFNAYIIQRNKEIEIEKAYNDIKKIKKKRNKSPELPEFILRNNSTNPKERDSSEDFESITEIKNREKEGKEKERKRDKERKEIERKREKERIEKERKREKERKEIEIKREKEERKRLREEKGEILSSGEFENEELMRKIVIYYAMKEKKNFN